MRPGQFGPWTVRPQGPTVQGSTVHFWGAYSWAPVNWAPLPNCPGPICLELLCEFIGPTSAFFTFWSIIRNYKSQNTVKLTWRLHSCCFNNSFPNLFSFHPVPHSGCDSFGAGQLLVLTTDTFIVWRRKYQWRCQSVYWLLIVRGNTSSSSSSRVVEGINEIVNQSMQEWFFFLKHFG